MRCDSSRTKAALARPRPRAAAWPPAATPATTTRAPTSRPRRTTTGKFEEGTRMAELAEAGEVTVGVKFDQPGLGFKDAAADIPTGLRRRDRQAARRRPRHRPRVRHGHLGGDDLRQPRALPRRRVASTWCSRRTPSPTSAAQIVGQTGPYLITGQQILVAGGQRRQGHRRPRRARRSARRPARPRSRTSRPRAWSPAPADTTPSASRTSSTAPSRRCRPTARSCSATPRRTRAS